MNLPDDFLAGLFWGVLLGVALHGLLVWGLDSIESRRRYNRDAPVIRPSSRRKP